jgi:hypothetical protein
MRMSPPAKGPGVRRRSRYGLRCTSRRWNLRDFKGFAAADPLAADKICRLRETDVSDGALPLDYTIDFVHVSHCP